MCVHYVCAIPEEARRGHWVPGAGVTGGCGPSDTGAQNHILTQDVLLTVNIS